MSSQYVRDQILDFIEDNVPEEPIVIDLTAEFDDLRDLLAKNGVSGNKPWLGIQFIGNEEIPITVSAHNTQGKYRETGAVYLHIVEKARLGVGAPLITRSETLRNAFRGQRIGSILIESVSPPQTDSGATLSFEGGYTSASVIIVYQRDLDL